MLGRACSRGDELKAPVQPRLGITRLKSSNEFQYLMHNLLIFLHEAHIKPPFVDQVQWDTSMGILSRAEMQRQMQAGKKLLEGIPPSCVVAKFGASRRFASCWHHTMTGGGESPGSLLGMGDRAGSPLDLAE